MDINSASLKLKELHGADIDTALSQETFVGSLRAKSRLEMFQEAAGLVKSGTSEAASDFDSWAQNLVGAGKVLVENTLSYYTANGWDKERVKTSISALLGSSVSRDNHDLVLLGEALQEYIEKGWKVSSLINAAKCLFDTKIDLRNLTAEHLVAFGVSYAVLDLKIKHFSSGEHFAVAATVSKMIESGASPELTQLFCSVYYRTSRAFREEITSNFIKLSELDLESTEVTLFSKMILCWGKDEESLHLHILGFKDAFCDVSSPRAGVAGKALRALLVEGMKSCVESKSEVLDYLQTFSEFLRRFDLPQNIYELLARSYRHHAGPDFDALYQALSFIAANAESLSPQMIANYIEADKKDLIKDSTESSRILGEIVAHSSVTLATERADELWSKVEGILRALQSGVDEYESRMVTPLTSPILYVKGLTLHPMLERVLTIQARMRDVYRGFGALAIEASKPPGGDECLLARLGSELGAVMRIYAKDANEFPGLGYIISRLDLSRIFVENKERARYPFYDYQEAWPYYAMEFMDLAKAEFIFTRGFIAVSVVGSDKYTLKQRRQSVSYSYVIFNDHFHNYENQMAFLVPTKLLRERILPSIYECDGVLFDEQNASDVNCAGLSARELLLSTKRAPPVLNIGSGANLLGGFGFSNPPESTPLFNWVKGRSELILSTNVFGHPSAGWSGKQLARLGKEDQRVFELINQYQNVFDLFRIAQALWHKGYTSGRGEFRDSGDLSSYESDYLDQKPRFVEGSRKDHDVRGEGSLLMLKEAFKWYQGVRLGFVEKSKAPLLVSCDTRGYSKIPDQNIVLDTADLSLKIGDETVKLSGDLESLSSKDKRIWLNEVMPMLEDTFVDIRFYKRDVLNF